MLFRSHSGVSREFPDIDGNAALDSEIYLRIPLGNGAGHITPSLQYIEIPGVMGENPVPESSALVAGLRFHWWF